MDTKMEDNMVHQIEKNLSNNINENLFQAGKEEALKEYPLVSNDYINSSHGISRAEYIRQAREACLRQLSSVSLYSKPYDVNYIDTQAAAEEQPNQKETGVMKLFHNTAESETIEKKKTLKHEMFSYRSLIIRSVCAIVLFLAIFLIEKFKVQLGNITPKDIQEYVTGNDTLQKIENILVTWLK